MNSHAMLWGCNMGTINAEGSNPLTPHNLMLMLWHERLPTKLGRDKVMKA